MQPMFVSSLIDSFGLWIIEMKGTKEMVARCDFADGLDVIDHTGNIREKRVGTTRKYIFSVELIAAASQIRRYKILIAAAIDDPRCNTIFKLL